MAALNELDDPVGPDPLPPPLVPHAASPSAPAAPSAASAVIFLGIIGGKRLLSLLLLSSHLPA
jgi:hypothetical protein